MSGNSETELASNVSNETAVRDALSNILQNINTLSSAVTLRPNVTNLRTMARPRESPDNEGALGREIRTMFAPNNYRGVNESAGSSRAPQFNYTGNSRTRSSSKCRRLRSGRSYSADSSAPCQKRMKTAAKYQSFVNEVVLLPEPACKVPRGYLKTLLHRKHFVKDCVSFEKDWTEGEIKEHLSTLFKEQLEGVEFAIMKSIGTSIVLPSLCNNETLNGSVLHRVFGKKIVYLSPTVQLMSKDSVSLSEDETDSVEEKFNETKDIEDSPAANVLSNEHNEDGNCSSSELPDVRSSVDVTPESCLSPQNDNLNEILQSQFGNAANYDQDVYQSYISVLHDEGMDSIENWYGFEENSDKEDNLLASAQEDGSKCSVTLKEILIELNSKISNEKTSKFFINRLKVKDSAIFGLKRSGFSPLSKIFVTFTDDNEDHEEGIDMGGPTREFLRLLIKEFICSSVFWESNGKKLLTFSLEAQASNMYYLCGLVFGMSIIHGGPGPMCLAKTTYDSLIKSLPFVEPTIDDIPNGEIKNKLLAIKNCETMDELIEKADVASDLRNVSGSTRPLRRLTDKNDLFDDLLHYCAVGRLTKSIEGMKEGLSKSGVLEKMEQFPHLFHDLFCENDEKLTTDTLRKLFKNIMYSDRGSNQYALEMQVVSFFWEYLELCAEVGSQVSLEDILIFSTGASSIPPLGFNTQPSVGFVRRPLGYIEQDDSLPLDPNSEVRPKRYLPTASSCSLTINLPIYSSFEKFKENMDFGIGNTAGFGMP